MHNNHAKTLLANCKKCPINKWTKYLFFVLNEFVNFFRIFLTFLKISFSKQIQRCNHETVILIP